MFAVEIENPFERDAMMSRIISSLQTDVILPSSTDPYEIMANLLQRSEMAKEDPDVIELTSRILQMIGDPFVRLSGLSLAESLIRLQDIPRAEKVLEEIAARTGNAPGRVPENTPALRPHDPLLPHRSRYRGGIFAGRHTPA